MHRIPIPKDSQGCLPRHQRPQTYEEFCHQSGCLHKSLWRTWGIWLSDPACLNPGTACFLLNDNQNHQKNIIYYKMLWNIKIEIKNVLEVLLTLSTTRYNLEIQKWSGNDNLEVGTLYAYWTYNWGSIFANAYTTRYICMYVCLSTCVFTSGARESRVLFDAVPNT